MAQVVIMPKQGQSVESCIVSEFKKKVGDQVAVGDVLFSYETDKASFDEESKVAGTVLACFFADGDEIPVLTNVMVIGNPSSLHPGRLRWQRLRQLLRRQLQPQPRQPLLLLLLLLQLHTRALSSCRRTASP